MKKFLLFLTLFLSAVGIAQAEVKSYTIEFKGNNGTSDATTAIDKSNLKSNTYIEDAGLQYISSFSEATNVFKGKGTMGLKFGNRNTAGSFTIAFAESAQVIPTKIVVRAAKWDTSNVNITINDNTTPAPQSISSSELTDYSWEFTGTSALTSAMTSLKVFNSDKRCYIKSVTVYYEDGTAGGGEDTKDCGIAFTSPSGEVTYPGTDYVLPFKNDNKVDVTFTSTEAGVATVANEDNRPKLTIVGCGTTTITASFAGDDNYDAKDVEFALTVNKITTSLSFEKASYTVNPGDSFTAPTPTLTDVPEAATITWESSATDVATVDANGAVTIKATEGTTTITATYAGDATHTDATASYTLTVAKQYIFADTKVTLVTDASTLQPGDVIIIAAYGTTSKGEIWNKAISTSNANADYRGETDVTFNSDHSEITSIPNDVMLIELEQTQYNKKDYWLFKTLNYTGDNGYLGNTAISSNNMRVVKNGNTNTLCYAAIESNDDNTVKVLFNLGSNPNNTKGSYNRNYLQYNQGSPRFACYGVAQTNGQVYIYKVETPVIIDESEEAEDARLTETFENGKYTLSASSTFCTQSTASEYVVRMNGVEITSAVVDAETYGIREVTLEGLPYIPDAKITIAPVVNGVEGHSEALGIQMPALPTFTVADSKTSLTYDGKKAETGTCNIDAVVKLYITSTAGEGAKPFNYYFDIENKSGFENHAWDWLNDDKGYGITYIVKDYLTDVTTQKQGEGENAVWTPELPTNPSLYATLEFDVKPYFVFNVTPELASLITEATPAPMAAPARSGEAFVLQNVYSTQVFEQHFNFSATTAVSGVEGVTVDGGAAVEYFNLQGVRVDGDLTPGIYIRRQGQSVSKVQIR